MEKWEYKYVRATGRSMPGFSHLPTEEELNALGTQGWELAGIATTVSGGISSQSSGTVIGGSTSSSHTLIFKRRKP